MNPLDVKALKKLADACRKAGIKEFKGYGFEFTLAESVPAPKKVKASSQSFTNPEEFKSDSLSDQELLFWSTGVSTDAPSESTE